MLLIAGIWVLLASGRFDAAAVPGGPGSQEAGPVRREVADVARSAAFYEKLGFRRLDGRGPGGVRLEQGSAVLEVATGKPAAGATDDALLVIVSDPVALGAELARKAVASEARRSAPGGRVSLRVVDPDGFVVVFRTAEDAKAAAGPAAGELNPLVVEVLERYPTTGVHRYFWPKSGGWRGCTTDLRYAGELLCAGDPEGRCYCCGLTFEVFFEAWRRWCRRNARPWRILDFDLDRVRRLQQAWFGSAEERTCMAAALADSGLGGRITDLEEARPGDFVQLWRHDGSGHSVVFLRWVRRGGRIAGLEYWSTQKATDGIGRRTEFFGEDGKTVNREEFHLCRAGLVR